jgi:putative acetyltransferase
MQNEILYRKIEPKDNFELAVLIRGVLKEFGVDKPGTVFTDPTTDNLFELFEYPNAVYFIAEKNEEILGACGLFPTRGLPDKCIELVKFYVKSAARGKGVGKKLMEICLKHAKEQKYKSVYLESLPELNKAVGMYEKAGFKHLKERLGESGHFACTILMLKQL